MPIETRLAEMEPALRRALLESTPDTATNIEARGFQLRDDTIVLRGREAATDLLLLAPLFRVALPIGRPEVGVIRETLAGLHEPWSFVAEIDELERWTAALPDWRYERAKIAERPEGGELPDLRPEGASIRLLEPGDRNAIAAVADDEVRDELEHVFGHVTSAAAFVDGRPVSFCSGYPETETRYDLAIDTLEAYRRRGLARATAAFLIREMAKRGKHPVWGALETNTASIRLAESLGFQWIGQLAVWEAPTAV